MIQSFKDGIGDPLVLLDAMFGSLRGYLPLTRDETLSLGLSLVVRGGRYNGNVYPDTTFTLSASTTTYVEADTTAHTIVSNTSGYSGGTKVAIGIAVTNSEGLTSWQQDGTIGGAGGGSAGPTGPGYKATSTTSLALASSGSASFTTQAGLAYVAGLRVRAVATAASGTYMEGVVSSYSGTTLVLAIDRAVGTAGTYSAWNLGIAGDRGATGASGGGGGGGSSPLATKGDLWGFDTADAAIPVGVDGEVLTADSAAASGVRWAAASGGSGGSPIFQRNTFVPEAPFSSPSALDDHFDSSTLDSKWSIVNGSATGKSWDVDTTREGQLVFSAATGSGETEIAALQPLPSGDFTAFACVETNFIPVNYQYAGLILSTTNTTGTGLQTLLGVEKDAAHTLNGIVIQAVSNFNTGTSTSFGTGAGEADRIYLRVRRAGSTYYFATSTGGLKWIEATFSANGTPAYIGFFLTNNNCGQTAVVSFDFFFFVASAMAALGQYLKQNFY